MENVEQPWFIVVNPHAGSGKTLHFWKKAEQLLQQKKVNYIHKATDCKFHATEMTYLAADEGYRRFVAVGGDGTVHEVLDGIMHYVTGAVLKGRKVSLSDFTLSVIPIGSGNDWIKSHNVPNDLNAVVDLIARESFARQDVVKVSILRSEDDDTVMNYSYMVNVGGVGFDARVCEDVNARKAAGKTGKLLYVKSLVKNLFSYVPSCAKVYVDGELRHEGAFLSMSLGLGRYSGGGLRQTPEALMDDGLLDLTLIPPLPLLKIAKEAVKLFNGKFWTVRELLKTRGKNVKVVPMCDRAELVEVDGEILGGLPALFEVLPEQINVLNRA